MRKVYNKPLILEKMEKDESIELCSLAEKFNNEILEEYLVKPEVEVLNILFEKLLSS